MAPLLDVAGMDPEYRERLQRSGVRTTERLLKVGAHRRGRQDLARMSGAPEALILRWIYLADLMRVKGVGPDYAALLAAAGIGTLRQLGARRPENLYRTLLGLTSGARRIHRRPSRGDVERWVREARKLRSKVVL